MVRGLPLACSSLIHAGAAGMFFLLGAGGRIEGPEVHPCVPDPHPVALQVVERADPVLFREPDRPVLHPLPDEPMLEFLPDREQSEIPEPEPLAEVRGAVAPSFDRPLPPEPASLRLPPPAVPEMSIVESAPAAIHNPPPEYPAPARRRGLEGEALVEITVLPDGTCGEALLVECSGSPLFGEAARAAVQGWRYRPAIREGRAVKAVVRIRFVFRLRA